MKILLDCSSLQIGGGIQVAVSFINDLKKIGSQDEFLIILSPQMESQLGIESFPSSMRFIVVSEVNYKNLFKRAKYVKNIELEFNPDVTFCVFGPSLYKSKNKKIVGFAIPHYIYSDSPFFKKISVKLRIKFFFFRIFKTYLFRRFSDFLVFETEDARVRFCKMYNFEFSKTIVVNNTLNNIFCEESMWVNKNLNLANYMNILCISANYPHKNLQIIPDIIDCLISKGIVGFKFHLTLNKEDLGFKDEYDNYINYIGVLNLNELPLVYKKMDVFFLPTLLEVFSTSYLEAMKMKLPILTTDLSFAKDICKDGAIYFSPLDSVDAANKLIEIIENDNLRNRIIQNSSFNLGNFGTSNDRTFKYLNLIHSIVI